MTACTRTARRPARLSLTVSTNELIVPSVMAIADRVLLLGVPSAGCSCTGCNGDRARGSVLDYRPTTDDCLESRTASLLLAALPRLLLA